MKRLYLLRHAKAAKDIPNIDDMERPLTARGYQDARRLGNWMAKQPDRPQLFISSPAVRAYSTALAVARATGMSPAAIVLDSRLYESTVEDYLETIAETGNGKSSLLLSGHNNVISDTARYFHSGNIADILPTCGMAVFDLDIRTWKDIHQAVSKAEILVIPSMLQ